MSATDHFTVAISSLDKDPSDQQSISGHTLTLSPDGRLSIEGQKGKHMLAASEWDQLEVTRLPSLEASLPIPDDHPPQ